MSLEKALKFQGTKRTISNSFMQCCIISWVNLQNKLHKASFCPNKLCLYLLLKSTYCWGCTVAHINSFKATQKSGRYIYFFKCTGTSEWYGAQTSRPFFDQSILIVTLGCDVCLLSVKIFKRRSIWYNRYLFNKRKQTHFWEVVQVRRQINFCRRKLKYTIRYSYRKPCGRRQMTWLPHGFIQTLFMNCLYNSYWIVTIPENVSR